MRPPFLARLVVVLALSAVTVAACGSTKPQAPASSVPTGSLLPTSTSVIGGRFASTIELDGGDLTVATPSKTAREAVDEQAAQTIFDAADVAAGTHTFEVFGLGVATISPTVESGSSTTTAPSATTVPSSAPATTVPSGAPVTTAAPTTVPASAPATTTTAAAAAWFSGGAPPPEAAFVDDSSVDVHALLAWVGIVWGGVVSCPATATKKAHNEAVATYEVVIVDAQSPTHVVAYSSAGQPACGGPSSPPSVSLPQELVSVPWQPVGATSTGIAVTVPPCGQYYGWTELPETTEAGTTVEVIASVPYNATCADAGSSTATVDSVVPLGQGAAIAHAPTGPINALDAL